MRVKSIGQRIPNLDQPLYSSTCMSQGLEDARDNSLYPQGIHREVKCWNTLMEPHLQPRENTFFEAQFLLHSKVQKPKRGVGESVKCSTSLSSFSSTHVKKTGKVACRIRALGGGQKTCRSLGLTRHQSSLLLWGSKPQSKAVKIKVGPGGMIHAFNPSMEEANWMRSV